MRLNFWILMLGVLPLSGCVSLHDSARAGDLEAVRAKATPETVNVMDRLSGTPLARAATACRIEVARLLLERGADPNLEGTLYTPLVEAIGSEYCPEHRRHAMVRLLVSAGADVNQTSSHRYVHEGAMAGIGSGSPLTVAIIEGQPWIVSYLLENGADPLALAGFFQSNALHDALHFPRPGRSSIKAVEQLVRYLQENEPGALDTLLRQGDRYGFTPLHRAAEKGDEEIMRHLVAAGANPHVENTSGQTPVMLLDKHNQAQALAQQKAQQQKAQQQSSGGALAFFQGLVTTANVISDPTGRAYNDHVAATIPALAPLANAANAELDRQSADNRSPGTAVGSGKGAVTPGSYPARPNTLLGHAACRNYTNENFKTEYAKHASGPDAQLHSHCAGAFNYYAMYLNAIRQGYSQADSDRTYDAFKKAEATAIGFYNSAR